MNKNRAETLSDSIFAIVMTLLVFDVKLPTYAGAVTNPRLWGIIASILPLIGIYVLSFLVLAAFWIGHNFLFESFMKELDHRLNLLNLLYLLFLVFVPFSALLFGTYPYNQPAALLYGLNILMLIIISGTMVRYLSRHKHLRNTISSRLVKQARVRNALTETSYVLGIIFTFMYIPGSIFFYIFPLVFNIIPGSLNLVEKIFKFELT